MPRTARLCALIVVMWLFALPAARARSFPDPQAGPLLMMVDGAAADGSSLDVHDPSSLTPYHFEVSNPAVQTKLKALKLQKGDLARISKAIAGGRDTLEDVDVTPESEPSRSERFLVLVSCAVGYLILCWALTLGDPAKLLLGEDGHYSNSKFQMAVWFGVLITTYVAAFVLRATTSLYALVDGITIPDHLLLLSGMSALTFAGAKGITTSKVQAAVNAGIPNPKPFTNDTNFLKDLTHNDRNGLDFGDFQMLLITCLAVATYLVLAFHFLGSLEFRANVSLPDVDSTILATFGLGQGAYLTKKAVGNVGDS